MIVSDVRVHEGDGYELSALVTFERPPTESARVWFRTPAELDAPQPRGDAFFAGLFVSCMALHENLTIEAPVASQLVDAAHDKIAPVLRRWYPRLQEVEVDAECCLGEAEPATPRTKRVATCFSAGVDSWYTAVKHRNRLDALVTIHGFEVPLDNEPRWQKARLHIERCARQLGLPLAVLATNLNDIGLHQARARLERRGTPYPQMGTDCYFGSYLVAVGLSLRPSFDELLIPSSLPDNLGRPYASHTLMEPNWSTDTMSFAIDGGDLGRIGKIEQLSQAYPEAIRRLRVCVKKTDDELNCGRCAKCVRTMAELRSIGQHELGASFTEPLDLDLIRRGLFPRIVGWTHISDKANANGNLELRDAIRVFMGDKFYWRRFLDNLRRHASRFLGRG